VTAWSWKPWSLCTTAETVLGEGRGRPEEAARGALMPSAKSAAFGKKIVDVTTHHSGLQK